MIQDLFPLLPFKLKYNKKWPYGYSIVDAKGNIVLSQTSCCHSTSQKTWKEHLALKGFEGRKEKAELKLKLEKQYATASLIVYCCNDVEQVKKFFEQYKG